MSNDEIITKAAIAAGIITESEAAEFLANGWLLPIHTFAEWKTYGYSVKKGEHAALKVGLWKKRNTKKTDEETGEEQNIDAGYFMTTAALFTAAQVERIEEKAS